MNSQKEEIIDEAVNKFQEVLEKTGLIDTANKLQEQLLKSQKTEADQAKDIECLVAKQGKQKKTNEIRGKNNIIESIDNKVMDKDMAKGNRVKQMHEIITRASDSELTIYKNAVEELLSKRESTSSEEGIMNSSDEIEIMDCPTSFDHRHCSNSLIDQFIADVRLKQNYSGETDE